MCQQIVCSLSWKGCKNQNTQTIFEILAIGETLGQQASMCKTKVWMMYIFKWHIFWKLHFQYEKFLQFLQSTKIKKFLSIQ